MEDNNKYYDLIIKELHKLNENYEKLSEEIQAINIELTKFSGLKHVIYDLKSWKENIERVVTINDFEDLKKLRTEFSTFKTRLITIGSIIIFLFTTALTVIGWFVS